MLENPENSTSGNAFRRNTVENTEEFAPPRPRAETATSPDGTQEHWSPDCLPPLSSSESKLPRKISESETGSLSYPREIETSITKLPAGANTETSFNAVRTSFDFDEDNLSDEEDGVTRLVAYHREKVDQKLKEGTFDDELHKHLFALVYTHKINDTKLVVCYAISSLIKDQMPSSASKCLSELFKFDSKAEPAFNLAGYIIRAQIELSEHRPDSGLKDCRRIIKLVEKYEGAGISRGKDAHEPSLNYFRNSAYRIAAICAEKIWQADFRALESEDQGSKKCLADKTYYESIYQPDIPNPSMKIGLKTVIDLNLLDDSGGWKNISLEVQSGETELEDNLLDETRAERYNKVDANITVAFRSHVDLYQNLMDSNNDSETAFELLLSRFEGSVIKFIGTEKILVNFKQRGSILRLLQFCLNKIPIPAPGPSQGYTYDQLLRNIAYDICTNHDSWDINEGIFSFDHPMIDPFAYHPPYAGLLEARIPVDKPLSLVAIHRTCMTEKLYERLAGHRNWDKGTRITIESALRIAISLDHLTFVQCVIQTRPQMFIVDDNSRGLIHAVIRSSWQTPTPMLRQILGRTNPNLHMALSNGGNIFHFAAYYSIDNTSAMECLLEYHYCSKCLLAKMTFRGTKYTPYGMLTIARPKHRLFGDDPTIISRLKSVMEKIAGPWVKENPLEHPLSIFSSVRPGSIHTLTSAPSVDKYQLELKSAEQQVEWEEEERARADNRVSLNRSKPWFRRKKT